MSFSVTAFALDDNSGIAKSLPAAADAPKNAYLGNVAESSSTPSTAPRNPNIRKRFKLLDTAAYLLPNERIASCQRHAAPMAVEIIGVYNPEKKTAHFHNLQRCDSYSCPVCANQRSEQDRLELSVAIAAAAKAGLFPVLITCTLRHDKFDQLHDLHQDLAKAYDRTFSGRWYQDLKDEYGIAGKVKAWESTYGANGWHPHMHVLMFMEMELVGKWTVKFGEQVKERWTNQLAKLGRDASWEHGIDVRTAQSDIAEYISKWGREPLDSAWGVEHELAKSPVKKAKKEGMTPFELLGAASADSECLDRLAALLGVLMDSDESRLRVRRRAAMLYKEYFYTFKGVPRLYWGKLKKLIDFDTAMEEFKANNPPEAVELVELVKIPVGAAWNFVVVERLLVELLEAIATGDREIVRTFMKQKSIFGEVMESDQMAISAGLPIPPRTDGRLFDMPVEPERKKILWFNPAIQSFEFVEEIPND